MCTASTGVLCKSCSTCRMSYVTRNTSHLTPHTSHPAPHTPHAQHNKHLIVCLQRRKACVEVSDSRFANLAPPTLHCTAPRVTCHTSRLNLHVMHHTSRLNLHVMHHTSRITCHTTRLPSHVIHHTHTSHVTHHTSHVTRHTSHVTHHRLRVRLSHLIHPPNHRVCSLHPTHRPSQHYQLCVAFDSHNTPKQCCLCVVLMV